MIHFLLFDYKPVNAMTIQNQQFVIVTNVNNLDFRPTYGSYLLQCILIYWCFKPILVFSRSFCEKRPQNIANCGRDSQGLD